jgi:hypothetical protein
MTVRMRTPSDPDHHVGSTDPDGREIPGWRDPWMRALLVLTLALQLFAWSRIEGYQIADSVEFMEIAQTIVRGEERVDAGVIRPIGFSFVLIPFFALADWIGMRDLRAVVWCVTLVEILLGLLLVLLATRIAARVGGRACGFAAGFLVATNPVFLQYSTQPESGIPAGVCIALALERLLVRRSGETIAARTALVGGLWLGGAFLIGYKTILISGVLLALIVLRDRWTHRRTWIAAGTGLAAALVFQSVLDWVMYDAFGASLFNYLAQNAGSVTTSVLLKMHFLVGGGVQGLPLEHPDQPKSFWLLRAAEVYRLRTDLTGDVYDVTREVSLRGKMHSWWYVTELPRMLAWPAIALLGLGVLAALATRNLAALMLIVVFAVNVAAMSNKGWKEYRLWLPMLAILMPVLGLGFAWLRRLVLDRWDVARRAVTVGVFAATGILSVRELLALQTRLFGGYWVAMDWVNERAARSLPERAAEAELLGHREPEHLRVAAAYHWAVFRRGSPVVDPIKLPWQLNMWKQYRPDAESGIVRQHVEDMSALEEVDVFLVHLPILSEHPELLRWVAANFEVAGAFHDQRTYGDLGPIFVLERWGASEQPRTFLRERRGEEARAFLLERADLRGALEFADLDDPEGDRIELLGIDVRDVPPEGYAWVTYHWRAARRLRTNWSIVERITAPDERSVWEAVHRPAYNALAMDALEPGVVVSESHLVVPSANAYRAGGSYRPIGGAYRRGDLLPLRIWVGLREFGPLPADGTPAEVVNELVPVHPGTRTPLRPRGSDVLETAAGAQFSVDGLVRSRGVLLPVVERARLSDDGRAIPD